MDGQEYGNKYIYLVKRTTAHFEKCIFPKSFIFVFIFLPASSLRIDVDIAGPLYAPLHWPDNSNRPSNHWTRVDIDFQILEKHPKV